MTPFINFFLFLFSFLLPFSFFYFHISHQCDNKHTVVSEREIWLEEWRYDVIFFLFFLLYHDIFKNFSIPFVYKCCLLAISFCDLIFHQHFSFLIVRESEHNKYSYIKIRMWIICHFRFYSLSWKRAQEIRKWGRMAGYYIIYIHIYTYINIICISYVESFTPYNVTCVFFSYYFPPHPHS